MAVAKTNILIKRFKLVAYVLVAVMVVVIAAVLAVRGGLEARLLGIRKQINVIDEQLTELKTKELELSYDSLILANAVKIVAQRKDFRQIINDVYGMTPVGSWVDNLSFSDDAVLVSFKSENVQAFRRMDSALTASEESRFDWLGGVVVTGVVRNGKAEYLTNVQMELKKPETKNGR